MQHLSSILMLLFAAAGPMRAQIIVGFGPESFSTSVEGTPVTFVGRGTVKLSTPPGQQRVAVEIDSQIDLSDLQRVVPGIVQTKGNRNDTCAEVIRLHTVALRSSAEVYVGAHYERWSCAIGKNKLFEQNGDVTIALDLVVQNQGKQLGLNAGVRDVHADGVLGGLLRAAVVGPYLMDWLRGTILKALDPGNLKGSFPTGWAPYNPTITAARFVKLDTNKLGVDIMATLSVSQDQVQKLIGNLKN